MKSKRIYPTSMQNSKSASHVTLGVTINLLIMMFVISISGCSKVETAGRIPGQEKTLDVVTFQGSPKPDWAVDSTNHAWTRSKTLHLAGDCVRGVYSVRVLTADGAKLGKPALCSMNEKFDWVFTLAHDGEYRLLLQPTTRAGENWGEAIPLDIRVDSTTYRMTAQTGGDHEYTTNATLFEYDFGLAHSKSKEIE